MQWHRHDQVKLAATEPFVVKRLAQPPRYNVPEVDLVAVFEFMNDISHHAATTICSDRRFKMHRAMRAIRTGKGVVNRSFKWFGAFLAERRNEADSLSFACGAEIGAGSNSPATNRAHRRIEK